MKPPPQTCGKVERWHKTLKKFLEKRTVDTLEELQIVLDDIIRYYNDVRPHQSRGRMTPRAAYDERAKLPANTLVHQVHHRIRKDTVDNRGHVTLRYLGKLRHLNVGWKYMGQTILLYIVDDQVDVVTTDGELVGVITLNPEKNYQPIVRSRPL